MSTVLVTGANGFVGSHLVPAIVDAGHHVLALVRSDEGGAEVERRLTPAQRAVRVHPHRRRHEARDAPGGARGRGRGAPPRGDPARLGRRRDAAPRQHRGDAQHPARPPGTPGIRRFVHLGALGVMDEPDLHYGSSKVKAMTLVRESGLDWTILSPSLLFGPRDGFFNILADLVRMSPGVVPITGKGEARFQPLAIGDLARAAVAGPRRRDDRRPRVPPRRAALLDVPRDRGGGPARDGQRSGRSCRCPSR